MQKTPVQMNEIYSVSVNDLGIHGEGIGKIEGFTIFIYGALPDEMVTVKIKKVKKSYAIGSLISIDKPSPYRVKNQCIPQKTCGACQISHLSYEGQLFFKMKHVKDVIQRIGKEKEEKIYPIIEAKHPIGYRNKMALPVGMKNGQITVGYYLTGTHEIIPSIDCMIQKEINNKVALFGQNFLRQHHIMPYDEKTGKGVFRHIMARIGDNEQLMIILITHTAELPHKEEWIKELKKAFPTLTSLYHNVQNKRNNVILGETMHLLWGDPTLTASIGPFTFDISPHAFFQVNQEQAEKLYNVALSYADLQGNETVIDAYCGTGTISLYLAQKAKHVIGIEIIPAAIENAQKNAEKNHVKNVEFHAADAADYLSQAAKKGKSADVIVLDPIRAGCSEKVIDAISEIKPKKIVYISCNVSTLARDIERLTQKGYTLQKVQPIDMFPETMHVECLSLLTKVQN